jgi:hypothetical protein
MEGLGGRRSMLLLGFALGLLAFASLLAARSADAAACPNEALRTGPSAGLPDCRAYEKVSPEEKNGADADRDGFPSQSTPDGDGLSFMSFGTFAGSPSGSFPNAYVARRGAGGWQTTSVSPPNPDKGSPGANGDSYEFSSDLSTHVTLTLLQGLAGASPLYENMFAVDPAGNYTWVNNMEYPVKLPDECPIPTFETLCWELVDTIAFAGSSEDFKHVLFESKASLLTGIEKLYRSDFENGSWQVSEVGIYPDGQPAASGSTAGSGSSTNYGTAGPGGDNRVINAMSADGANVIFQAQSDEGEPNEVGQIEKTEVYDRIGGTHTIELSAPAPGATPANPAAGPATYWAASTDGSRVFFTSPAELTTPSNTGPAQEGTDLYEYNFAGGGTLTDLTVDGDGAGAQVLGVLNASDDGSTIYFVARGELVDGEGVEGEPNLYMVHNGGAPVFIATLSESDVKDWMEPEFGARPGGAQLESYVTPSGANVAFTSVMSLPTVNFPAGYENVNPATATAEREVYEYSAASGQLVCASCDPSGAPPISPGMLGGVRRPAGVGTSQNSAFHLVRAISANGGRVFFSSEDHLVPGIPAASTTAKVYEFEAQGEGTCATPGGCVNLLSSPTDTREAVFMEADETGQNVYISTGAKLTQADLDSALDVYDARVDGGFPEPPPVVPCEAEGCRGPGTSAAPPTINSPTTAFKGPGNGVKKTAPKKCRKGQVKKKGRCVKKQGKKHHKKAKKSHKGKGGHHKKSKGNRRAGANEGVAR